MRTSTRLLMAALLAVVATTRAGAADMAEPSPPPERPAADALAAARGHLKAQRWAAAIDALKKVDAAGDADWNNLMGYALRKQAHPDLDGAQRYYDAALKINPQHRGALEYSGELALMKGDLATAEVRLAALARLCSTPCEPLDDLKQSIARFKATRKP